MSDSEIEKRLTELGRTTEPQTSMRAEVMRRVDAMAGDSSSIPSSGMSGGGLGRGLFLRRFRLHSLAEGTPSLTLPRTYRGREKSGRRRFARAASLLLATAACIAVMLFVRRSRPEPTPLIVLVPATQPDALPAAEAFPRLADFRRAYAQCPEAFERLLQQPAPGASHAAEVPLSVGDVVHLDSKLYQ